jgi:hypothetical protein
VRRILIWVAVVAVVVALPIPAAFAKDPNT